MDKTQKDNLQNGGIKIKSITGRLVVTLVILTIIILSWIVWKTYQADNLGFKGKTLWDWLELLVTPLQKG